MDNIKRLLVIVDFQNVFAVDELGPDEAVILESRIEECIKKHLNKGDDIVFTLDRAGAGSTSELYGKISKYYNNAAASFCKSTYGSLELGNWLMNKNYHEIEICGLVSNMCVIANAVIAKSALPDAEIIIDSSLTASCDDELGLKALAVMKGMHFKIL